MGILDESTDSVAAKRYCCEKDTDKPIVKLDRQNNTKKPDKTVYGSFKLIKWRKNIFKKDFQIFF